jgi:hypothetical protein
VTILGVLLVLAIEDGSYFCLYMIWQYYDDADPSGSYRQMELEIYPQEPENKEGLDRAMSFDPKEMQVTEVNGVTVYGDGNQDTLAKFLVFTLPDGSYCQLSSLRNVPCEDMVTVMEWIVDHGAPYTVFALDESY